MKKRVQKILRFTFLCTLLMCIGASSVEELQSVKVKSAYLINFVRFINWPQSKKQEVTIGFLSDSKLEDYLNKTKTIAEKRSRLKINIVHFNNSDTIFKCDILYVENSKILKKYPELINFCEMNNVLIVTSRNIKFPTNSCINFVVINNKLRFEINNEILKKHKLKVSAQLLKLSYKR